jgi:hypothetical protein
MAHTALARASSSALEDMDGSTKGHLGPLFHDKQTPTRSLACRGLVTSALHWWINSKFHQ